MVKNLESKVGINAIHEFLILVKHYYEKALYIRIDYFDFDIDIYSGIW